jgi:periodic tryptophan protein 2
LILHKQNFKEPIKDVQFSPDGKFVAITLGKKIQFWKTPSLESGLEFSPFVLHREIAGPYDDVMSLKWSSDSLFVVAGCRDLSVRLFSVDPVEGFEPPTLTGHRDVVVSAWFSSDKKSIYSVSRDGALFEWRSRPIPGFNDSKRGRMENHDEDEEEVWDEASRSRVKKRRQLGHGGFMSKRMWTPHAKHFFNQNHSNVVSADFHPLSNLLVVGFASGVFGLWELPDFTNIHTLRYV